MSSRFIERIRIASSLVGSGLIFVGERYFESAPYHWWISGLGLSLVVFGVVAAGLCFRAARGRGDDRELVGWRLAIFWQSLILCSVVFYYTYVRIMGTSPAPDTFAKKALLAAWVVLALIGFFMGIGTEWAQAHNGRGEFAEPQRVRLATRSWLKVGLLAIIISSLNYVAVKRNVAWDLSYLKTTRASESTNKMIENLDRDVEVALFFFTWE